MNTVKYTADFETTTKAPSKVWAWGICSIENPDSWYYGEKIEQFFDCCEKLNNPTCFFHNLKFDGSFILYYLLKHGYKWRSDKKDCNGHDFTTLITGEGQFYIIEVYFQRENKRKPRKVTFYDSLKLLNMPVRDVAKSFDLPIKKGEIDYNRHNEECEVTAEEKDYLKNDVQIMAMALKEMFSEGFERITIGACSLADYKNSIGKEQFEKWFPKLSIDDDSEIRMSYKGGFTFVNPEHENEEIGEGIVLDVNSLYPFVMHDKPLPYGKPIKYIGQYPGSKLYNLYVQTLKCMFELKRGYLPTIQIKHSRFFSKTEYLTSSKNKEGVHELVTITLTSVDLELFFKHYEVFNVEYISGYMFKSSTKLFADWVDKWTAKKIEAGKAGNKGKRTIAKLVLNNLYGKFSTNPKGSKKFPLISEINDTLQFRMIRYELTDENGNVLYNEKTGEPETTPFEIRDSLYIPVGTFVTSWARYITITTSQLIHEESKKLTGVSRYLYSDTDSIHLIGLEEPENVFIDDNLLGAWKKESIFERGKFIQAKRYIEDTYIFDKKGNKIKNGYGEIQTYLKVTCAGLPAASHKFVTWENFKIGQSYSGKLVPKQVTGGTILEEILFTLK